MDKECEEFNNNALGGVKDFYFMCKGVCLHVYIYPSSVLCAHRSQKMVLNLLQQELQMVVSCHMLGIEPRSSPIAVSVFNHQVISQAPSSLKNSSFSSCCQLKLGPLAFYDTIFACIPNPGACF